MRRLRITTSLGILGCLLLVLGPLAALVAPAPAFAQAEITCDDFARQEAAQALLDADDSYADVLDPDGDGVACNEGDEGDEGGEDEAAEEEAAGDEAPVDEVAEDEAAEDEADEPASRNPLRGRFGGNREDFENAHGQPADDREREYPVGVLYEIEGFRRVSVYFHRGYVAYVTLLAARDDPWTQVEAEEIAMAFLPADWEQTDPPIVTEGGDLLIPGHSEYLETRFSAATYERYGAQGEQGDVYFLIRLDANGEVPGIEIGLGNDVQRPAGAGDEGDEGGEAAGEDVDADAAEYLEDVRAQFDRLVAGVDEFTRIITDPSFATDEALFDRLVEILLLWSSASANAERLEPPAGFEELHESFSRYAELLSGAAADLTVGLSSGDQASIQAGGEQLQQAIELQPVIEQLLVEAGV